MQLLNKNVDSEIAMGTVSTIRKNKNQRKREINFANKHIQKFRAIVERNFMKKRTLKFLEQV